MTKKEIYPTEKVFQPVHKATRPMQIDYQFVEEDRGPAAFGKTYSSFRTFLRDELSRTIESSGAAASLPVIDISALSIRLLSTGAVLVTVTLPLEASIYTFTAHAVRARWPEDYSDTEVFMSVRTNSGRNIQHTPVHYPWHPTLDGNIANDAIGCIAQCYVDELLNHVALRKLMSSPAA